jgi:hypothetical protein
MFRARADWTLTHTSHKDTEQSTIEVSITLDGVTPTDSLIRWSPTEWTSVCRELPVSADKMFRTSNKPEIWTPYISTVAWRFNPMECTFSWKNKLNELFKIFPPFMDIFRNQTLQCSEKISERKNPLLHYAQTGSGAHPASYPMGAGSYFTGSKAAGTWSWPLTST